VVLLVINDRVRPANISDFSFIHQLADVVYKDIDKGIEALEYILL